MRCHECGTELIVGKSFCHACGAQAGSRCSACGSPLVAGFRFCPDCGTAVAVSDGTPEAAPPAAGATREPSPRVPASSRSVPEELAQKIRRADASAGERKRVTVFFCDLVGSTAIAERLDPELYREVLEQYLELAFAQIYRFEGIVNQLAGDGLMALFGAPITHEDDPERAIRAALAIHEELDPLSSRLEHEHGIPLSARIGIHTGMVVVGTVGNDLKMDYTAIGDTTNLAARLQTLARPGSILISDATHALVPGRIRTRPTGPLEVKGKREPVSAHEVTALLEAQTPMALAKARGLTPLVGRRPELAQLEACFHLVEQNLAQMIAISGDAGSGKSRLVYEFMQRLAGESAVVFEARCSSLTQGMPYAPWIEMLRRFFELRPDGSDAEARAKLEARTRELGAPDEELVPYLGRVLSLYSEELADVPVDLGQQRTFEAFAQLIGRSADGLPVVMVIEDLHWIDDASLDMLELAVSRSGSARIMLIVTHRPEYRPPAWRSSAVVTQLHLRLLSDSEAREIVRARSGGPLPPALESRIVRRAEGNPFFLEELTRALVEEGTLVQQDGSAHVTRPLDEVRIPDTVQELVAARLDRLRPAAKRVAQLAAVLGRQFRRDQLAFLLAKDPIDVDTELAELESRGVIHRLAGVAEDEFRFGESLTQEVAYESLLHRERRELHERVGCMLAERSERSDAAGAALIAHHFARGEDREKGVECLIRAAEEAERLPSYADAVRLYREAFAAAEALLGERANGSDSQRRWALRAAQGICSITVISGGGAAEDEGIARRGTELAAELGDDEARVGLLAIQGTLAMSNSRERFGEGLALVEQGVAEARRAGLEASVARLSRTMAWAYLLDGRFDDAHREQQAALAELERLGLRKELSDIFMGTRFFEARMHMESDDLQGAQELARELWQMAESVGNRTLRSASGSILGTLHLLRAEYDDAERWALQALEIAEQIKNKAAIRSCATVVLGVRAARGEAGISAGDLERLESGLLSSGDHFLNADLVVETLLALGEVCRAQRIAEQAALRAGGRLREAKSALSLGRVALQRGRPQWAAAERHLSEAARIAAEIGARSLLARAELSRSRLATLSGRAHSPAPDSGLDAGGALRLLGELGHTHYRQQAERELAEDTEERPAAP